jgi:UPF0716 family protein affecting phage T7 exclusion
MNRNRSLYPCREQRSHEAWEAVKLAAALLGVFAAICVVFMAFLVGIALLETSLVDTPH